MKRALLFSVFVGCGGTQVLGDAGAPDSSMREAGPGPCGNVQLSGLQIATIQNANPLDPLGYPPYAADGCQLAYVAKDGTLMLRNLKLGTEVVAADSNEKPRRPTIAGGIVAWEATLGGKDLVRWRNAGGIVETIAGSFERAGEPHAAADAIVLTVWTTADTNGDTDVLLFSTTDKSLVAIGDGPAQQRFPTIDATRAAWSDFSEGGSTGAFEADPLPDGAYSPADIVIYDRASKTKQTRKAAGKQAFPLLVAGGAVAYLDWATVRPQPKFFEYGFKVGASAGDPSADQNIPVGLTIQTSVPYVRPAAYDKSFEWLEGGQLWQRPTDLSTAPVRIDGVNGAWSVVPLDSLSIVAVGSFNDITLLGLNH